MTLTPEQLRELNENVRLAREVVKAFKRQGIESADHIYNGAVIVSRDNLRKVLALLRDVESWTPPGKPCKRGIDTGEGILRALRARDPHVYNGLMRELERRGMLADRPGWMYVWQTLIQCAQREMIAIINTPDCFVNFQAARDVLPYAEAAFSVVRAFECERDDVWKFTSECERIAREWRARIVGVDTRRKDIREALVTWGLVDNKARKAP